MSNMQVVEADFIKEFIIAYEMVFEKDSYERKVMREQSANHRRRFLAPEPHHPADRPRWRLLQGECRTRMARSARRGSRSSKKQGPFGSERAYQKAIKEAAAAPRSRPRRWSKGHLV